MFHTFLERTFIDINPVLKTYISTNNFNFSTLSDIKINSIVDDVVHGLMLSFGSKKIMKDCNNSCENKRFDQYLLDYLNIIIEGLYSRYSKLKFRSNNYSLQCLPGLTLAWGDFKENQVVAHWYPSGFVIGTIPLVGTGHGKNRVV